MNLRFWEFHRFGPYLVVQSQYVLVNKWALQEEQERGGEKHKEGMQNNRNNQPLGFIKFNDGQRKLPCKAQGDRYHCH